MHARLRSERERAGIFRPLRRQFRHVFVDRLQRHHEERIFARLAPAGEGQPARRLQRLAQVRKRQRGIGKEHHAEARDQEIKTVGLERIDGRIRQHEIDRQTRRRGLAGAGQHRPRNVDPHHMSAWADLLRERDGDGAAAAADVDDALAGFGSRARRSEGPRPAEAGCPATAADRPSAGRPVRSSTRSGRRFGRGLLVRPWMKTFCRSASLPWQPRRDCPRSCLACRAEAREGEGWRERQTIPITP